MAGNQIKKVFNLIDDIENTLRGPTLQGKPNKTSTRERPGDLANRLKDMARTEKARRKDRRDKNALVFGSAEEVIEWYNKTSRTGPCPETTKGIIQ